MKTEAKPDWLTVLVADLRGRGVSFTMRGPNRLIVRPWKLLTDAEQGTVTAVRPALKALISGEGQHKAGDQIVEPEPPLRAVSTVPSTLASTVPSTWGNSPAEPPAKPRGESVCAFCYQQPCIGDQHPAYYTLHKYSPLETEKRDAKAFAEMLFALPASNRRRGYK